jgi:hypothetical protein
MTKMKELPSKDHLLSKYYVKDGLIYWAPRIMTRNRPLVRAHRMVNIFIDEFDYLRVILEGQTYMLSRIVYQMTHGDLTPDYEIDHIDCNKMNNLPSNLRKVEKILNARNRPKLSSNTSGVQGVCLNVKRWPHPNQDKFTEYFRTDWVDLSQKRHCKYFNIAKLGRENAYAQAVELRQRMMQHLNEQGAGFTESHGTVPKDTSHIEEYLKANGIPRRTKNIRKKLKE